MQKFLDIPLTLIAAILITCVMLWPLEALPEISGSSDKLLHFITFTALAFALARTGRFGFIPVLIAASAFGGTIELIQPAFNRGASISDWIADTMGALIGICLALWYKRVRDKRAQV